jgi:hypothetical protein
MANTYYLIEKVIVGAGPTTQIDFNSIPQTYTDLIIKMSYRQDGNANGSQASIVLNGNTNSIYSRGGMYGYGTGRDYAQGTSQTHARFGFMQSASFLANTFASAEMYIPNYAGSLMKSFNTISVNTNNASEIYAQGAWVGQTSSTDPITSITIKDLAGTLTGFAQYSTFYLYGILYS